MGVIDLSKVDAVTAALASFNDATKATADHQVEVIGTARSNAQLFGQIGESADDTASISSVDLSDFMRLVATLSKDAAVKTSAKAVIKAVSDMVVYHKASASLPHANGLSVFFPQNSDSFTAADGSRYQQEFGTSLATWQERPGYVLWGCTYRSAGQYADRPRHGHDGHRSKTGQPSGYARDHV